MKKLVLALSLILSLSLYAQNEPEKKNVFVRVYDLQGKKIGKGKIFSMSDNALQLNRKEKSSDIPLNNIGSIKTKRSAGNNVLIGAATGATTLAILGAGSADPDAYIFGYTAAEGALSGALVGGVAGGAIGAITVLFKNSESYEINGDTMKWKAFKETISNQ